MRLLLILTFLVLYTNINAQLDFGEFNTPYAGVHALQYNPAEIVDSRYKFHLNLFGTGVSASNNYVGISSKLMTLSPPNVVDSNRKQYIFENLNGKVKHGYAQVNIPTLSFLFNINEKHSFALSTGLNLLASANNVDEKLAMYMYDNKDSTRWQKTKSQNIGAGGTAWSYIGLTYGREILHKKNNFLKMAATVKLNIGLASAYARSNDMFINITGSKEFSKANGSVQNQYGSDFVSNGKSNYPGFEFKNTGLGLDIGAIYEKRDGENYNYEFDCKMDNVRTDLNKYRYRIGFSIVDFGFIGFNPSVPLNFINFDSSKMAIPITPNLFNKAGDWVRYRDSLTKYGTNGVSIDTTPATFQFWTPTSLNLFFDYHIYKGLYVAANGSYSFVLNNFASSWTQNTRFNVVPRIESKFFGLYLPINYNMLAQELSVGVGFRLLFFNLAIQDWTGLAQLKKSTKSAGFNISFNVPLHNRKHPRDNDHDLISNKKDKCKNQAGDCNSDGCAEPDDDGDGVTNSMDKCPNQKGPQALDGCPDVDEDGIADKDDRCPRTKGLKSLGGCPDKDGDGITDKEDKCPNDKGPIDFQGCPDSDKDNIPDNLDECPTEPGTYESRGCPDKVLDQDNDGIVDSLDQCPKVFGVKSNNGCPAAPPKEALDYAKMAQESLAFHTASYEIKKESMPNLIVLSEYLVKNPTIQISLSGHTDNVGKPERNMTLSINRANAVKKFFESRGIQTSRITANGYGDTQPIADNNTQSGRTVNRRVEIVLK